MAREPSCEDEIHAESAEIFAHPFYHRVAKRASPNQLTSDPISSRLGSRSRHPFAHARLADDIHMSQPVTLLDTVGAEWPAMVAVREA